MAAPNIEPDPKTLSFLNEILVGKLTGINQYFLHARMLKHQGQLKLADYIYKSSIDAMKFSDMLVEHILQLGGRPNMQELGTLSIGATAREMLENDRAHAEASMQVIRKAEAHAAQAGQAATAELLKRVAETQAEHMQALQALLSSPQTIKDCA